MHVLDDYRASIRVIEVTLYPIVSLASPGFRVIFSNESRTTCFQFFECIAESVTLSINLQGNHLFPHSALADNHDIDIGGCNLPDSPFYLTELLALTMNQTTFCEDYILDIPHILLHQAPEVACR